MSEEAVSIRDLSVSYGDFVTVKGFSFDLKKGEILGLYGYHSSGKTSILRAIVGLVDYRGEVITSAKIGYMPQNISLYENLTVEENLRFFAIVNKVKDKIRNDRVKELLNSLGLRGHRDVLVRYLGWGVRYRLMLAISMIHDPDVLILDEPDGDILMKDMIWDVIVRLKEVEKGILIATSNVEVAGRCDRLVLIRDGMNAGELEPGKIGEERIIVKPFKLERAIAALDEFGFRYAVSEDGVEVIVDDASLAIPEILEMLRRRGIEVERVDIKRLSLREILAKILG